MVGFLNMTIHGPNVFKPFSIAVITMKYLALDVGAIFKILILIVLNTLHTAFICCLHTCLILPLYGSVWNYVIYFTDVCLNMEFSISYRKPKCHFYTVIGIMGPRFVSLKIICYNYSISQASLVPQMVTICLQ